MRRPEFVRIGGLGFGAAIATALILPLTAPAANAQSSSSSDLSQGTPCEKPEGANMSATCVMAALGCAGIARSYGRSEDEQNRIYRGCIIKIAAKAKREEDRRGDAVRQAFGGGDDRTEVRQSSRKKKIHKKTHAATGATQAQ